MKNKIISILSILILVVAMFGGVAGQEATVCCERTNYGAWCQEAVESECDEQYRKAPTSCEATSYCRLGCCYDSSEGVCMENTPQKVCDNSEGTWQGGKECAIPQCDLGCCVLGTQAAFVTLTRCKKLSSFYGLLTDFRSGIRSEVECVSLASLSDEGSCVFELDYARTCKFTSRQECNSIKEGSEGDDGIVTGNVTFYKDFLCSAEELGTGCGPTKETRCIDGKDEVYFIDSCGNPANIYDAGKVDDKAYWRETVSKVESCGFETANVNSRDCGNCNYFDGSICKEGNARYGDYICGDLNCKDASDGKTHKHGESWCSTDKRKNSVGSRYYRHLCMNGEEIIEPCADYRQETCVEDEINGNKVAACTANKWESCYSRDEKDSCENEDKRDCEWVGKNKSVGESEEIFCIPKNSPGLKFWEEKKSGKTCSMADAKCVVKFEKTGVVFALLQDAKCIENCECWDEEKGEASEEWIQEQLEKCERLGDCGAKRNFAGKIGESEGYDVEVEEKEEEKENGGGLFGLHLVLDKFGLSGKSVQNQEEGEDL